MNRRPSLAARILLATGALLLLATSSGAGNRRIIGFPGGKYACTGCHGLPPVSACETPTGDERVENYFGGGGAHRIHVAFLRAKLTVPTGYDARLCSPCHGANPGSATWHNGSVYPIFLQAQVDLVDGNANWGSLATYDGAGANGTPVTTGAGAKGGEPQACANFDCHGPGAAKWELDLSRTDPYNATFAAVPGFLRWDQLCIDGASTVQAKKDAGRANACAGCHGWRPGAPATSIVVGGYTSVLGAQGVTANYFGTVSGYGRGGHGDPKIQAEDPAPGASGRPNAPGTTPLDCTACHSTAVAHFPAPSPGAAANPHRLTNTTIENDSHSNAALCSVCHAGANYPTNHHASYYVSVVPAHPVIPASGQPVMTAISGSTTWTEVPSGSLHYQQNAYGAGGQGLSGNPDKGVDWWRGAPGTTATPQPRPVFYGEAQSAAPKANLPVEQYVLGSGSSNRMMCVTCHNPHGTDLYVHDTGGIGTGISDNNMLRLRDEDNTLCDACHWGSP